MKINDLEQQSGLDRATIRYYEKEGLLAPERLENGYREYSEQDKDQLLKIRLLRQLGMSLDRIKKLQQGSEDFTSALDDQLQTLESGMQSAERAKSVCEHMRSAGVRFETLDAQSYLDMLNRPAVPAATSVEETKKQRVIWEEYHPFRRYVARIVDYKLIQALLMFVFIVLLRIRPYSDVLSNFVSYGTPFLAVPLMALMLSVFGTTPGKWVMGLGVVHMNGYRLDFSSALEREWNVLRYGYGFGIPFWKLWRLYKSYQECGGTPMTWDYRNKYVYRYWDAKKKIQLAVVVVLIISLSLVNTFDIVKPQYRGDITVAEFAENYNDYIKLVNEDVSDSQLMKENGTFPYVTHSGNVIYVDSGMNKSERVDFFYETEGEYIRKITYENTWTDIFALDPLGSKLQLAAITVILSQDQSSIFTLLELSEQWEDQKSQETGHITFHNVEIRWSMTATNCNWTSSGYMAEDSEEPSSVTVNFEIIVNP